MNNKVELIDYLGGDKHHSLAAWSSTFLEFGLDMPDNINMRVDHIVNHILNNGQKKRSIQDLLAFLASNGHSSPFRFSTFIFGMTTDIATHIQKLKHSVLLESENSESHRYKELKEDKFYIPEDWNDIKVNTLNDIDNNYFKYYETWKQILEGYTEIGNRLYHDCLKDLTPVLGKARAKETARYFKTYNSQLNTTNKLSFDGVLQFYHKRNNPHAQKEIAFVASEMVRLIKEIPGNPFKYSIQAFGL